MLQNPLFHHALAIRSLSVLKIPQPGSWQTGAAWATSKSSESNCLVLTFDMWFISFQFNIVPSWEQYIHTYIRTYVRTYVISYVLCMYACVRVSIICIFELAWKWWDSTLIAIWLGKYINESRHSGLPSGNFTVCYRKWPCVWLIFHDFPMEKWSCWILRLWKKWPDFPIDPKTAPWESKLASPGREEGRRLLGRTSSSFGWPGTASGSKLGTLW